MDLLLSTKDILQKFDIDALNEMQVAASESIEHNANSLILAPTGSGKTLAFLIPIVHMITQREKGVQALILAPSRELAIQIEQVARQMGSGLKVNVVYGGRPIAKDFEDLKELPEILIGTPGRILDHLRRETIKNTSVHTIVLDEFDKSLEIGFEEEMNEILTTLPFHQKKILTSATYNVVIPDFVNFNKYETVDYLGTAKPQIEIKKIVSPDKDKLDTLVAALRYLGDQSGIVFCNYKDSIQRISDRLEEEGITHGCFYGGLDQKDRERALIKFRNKTHRLIIATDLAARGIDVKDLDFIIHYHLPYKASEFTHRNGRTGRMNASGTAYVLTWAEDELPDFMPQMEEESLKQADNPKPTEWTTIFISGGRKDKISKGDIAGLLMKKGGLDPNELGVIELKPDCAFVAVKKSKAVHIIDTLNNSKIKKRKVRIKLI